MKKFFSLKIAAPAFIALFIIATSLFFAFKPYASKEASSFSYPQRLKLSFLESGTSAYLKNIRLSIPEIGFQDDDFTSGEIIEVPDSLAFVTACVYKEGYLDTAVFFIPLSKGRLSDYTYYLFKRDASDLEYIVYCETPTDDRIKTVLDQNRFD